MRLADARAGLDDVIHSPVRLSLMCALATVETVDAQTLVKELNLSYALLSKHTALLEQAGYLKITKTFLGRTPATFYRLTTKGRKAFAAHLACLDRLVLGLAADAD